ncbi:MAG: SMC-Scp complex subunit ScpB [Saccharofermentanales bacterium]
MNNDVNAGNSVQGVNPDGEETLDVSFLRMQTAEDLLGTEDEDRFQISEEDIPAAIESILFAYGEAVALDRLAGILGIEKEKAMAAVHNLMNEVKNSRKRGILIRQIEESFILSTKTEMSPVIERMFIPRNRPPMSQAAYETLAIIAYNQPVTRSQVEAVRGVGSDSIIARLAEKNLVRECGTLDAPGRPSLFETTELFLKEFGLSSVRELPPMDMIMYRTLRDIETSVAEAAGVKTDSQMTIEQLVSSVIPGNSVVLQDELRNRDEESQVQDEDSGKAGPAISENDVMEISEAFFGEEKI